MNMSGKVEKIDEIQVELGRRGIPAWLFYDHHHRDAISYRVLGWPESLLVSLLVAACNSRQAEPHPAAESKAPFPPRIDAQRVQNQQDVTWDDYHPIPGKN
jgi:hypothetical protein